MINALVDFGPQDGVNLSVGAGVGGAKVKYVAGFVPTSTLNFTGSESGLAWQLLAELRAPLSGNVDAGSNIATSRRRSSISVPSARRPADRCRRMTSMAASRL
jgi:Opacity protein and related surface antigens